MFDTNRGFFISQLLRTMAYEETFVGVEYWVVNTVYLSLLAVTECHYWCLMKTHEITNASRKSSWISTFLSVIYFAWRVEECNMIGEKRSTFVFGRCACCLLFTSLASRSFNFFIIFFKLLMDFSFQKHDSRV